MRLRRALIFGVLIGATIAVGLLWSCASEAERVEADAIAAVGKLALVRKNAVRSSPRLMVEMTLRHSKDPEGNYQ